MNEKITKKQGPAKKRATRARVSEYRFDYGRSRPNRFAVEFAADAVVVVLDPDVSKVFRDSKRVNALLRATIAAVENRGSRRAG